MSEPPHKPRLDAKYAEVERNAVADAHKIVGIWNARSAGGWDSTRQSAARSRPRR